ncbi:hypothetical protein BC828DRAFT_385116 [Blastocladiella britannica]|nr:hypothetical protein BC828DRAFT_385116 [Blastocladiella britannica]
MTISCYIHSLTAASSCTAHASPVAPLFSLLALWLSGTLGSDLVGLGEFFSKFNYGFQAALYSISNSFGGLGRVVLHCFNNGEGKSALAACFLLGRWECCFLVLVNWFFF